MKRTSEKLFTIDPLSLVKDRTLTFDVFILLPLNDRVILYRRKGIAIEDLAPLHALREKGLEHLYVRESDRAAYEKYLKPPENKAAPVTAAQTAPPATNDEPVPEPVSQPTPDAPRQPAADPAPAKEEPKNVAPDPTPEEVAVQAAELAKELETVAPPVPNTPQAKAPYQPAKPVEQVMAGLLAEEPEKSRSVEEAKNMVKDILKKTGAPAAIQEIVENPDTEHATTVAIYTTLFAMGLKKNEQQILQDLIIASLLHDIGMTQLDPTILAVASSKQSPPQKQALEAHITLGLSMLGDLDYLPNKRVITLLHQHHEKFNGTGYPQHLESFRIEDLAQIIAIADLIDSVSRGRYDGVARSLSDSMLMVAKIEKSSVFPEHFNPDIFKRVMNWLKKGGGMDFLAAAEAAVNETKQKMLKAA